VDDKGVTAAKLLAVLISAIVLFAFASGWWCGKVATEEEYERKIPGVGVFLLDLDSYLEWRKAHAR
jgi:hypothetical protein